GIVRDALTGKPITHFAVFLKEDIEPSGGYSSFERAVVNAEGRYTFQLMSEKGNYSVEIRSEGYFPQIRPGKEAMTWDLVKAVAMRGVGLTPDGRPAENATVAYCTFSSGASLHWEGLH